MELVLKRGWAADPSDKFGIATLTADMLNEGTKDLTALQISDSALMLGAQLSTSSTFDGTYINLNSIKKNFPDALDLMTEIVLNPTFPDKELERLRKDYLAEIQQESKQPYAIGYKAFRRLVYGEDHPYGQPYTGSGTEESIKAISRDDLENFYKANYCPNVAAVVISGDLSLSEARSHMEKAFGKWKSKDVADVNIPDPKKGSSTKVYIIDKPGAEQSMIMAGHAGMSRKDMNFLPFRILNRPLGGQFTSRINLNLREDKGYTYGARSIISTGLGIAPFYAYSPVHAEFTKEALFELVKEISDVVGSRPISDEELTDSKNGLIKSFPQNFQNLGGITNQLANLFLYGLPLDNWATYARRVSSVNSDKITKVANQYIRPDELVIIVVGDRAKIEQDVKELNFGEVELIISMN
jgi:zinc protease